MLERMLRDRGADGSVIVDDRMTLLDLEKKLAGREIKGSDELLFMTVQTAQYSAMTAWKRRNPVVPLRNGGRITIESTLALTAIDVRHGRGGKRSEATTQSLNNAAAQAIPDRQLNIAGLIVVDFIGMRRRITGES